MPENEGAERDLSALELPQWGRLRETDDPWDPYQLIDKDGRVSAEAQAFFKDLQAAGRENTTLRSYALDLLRWLRFLWVLDISWDRATSVEARDFMRWMLLADKPVRVHWRLQLRPQTTTPKGPGAVVRRPSPATPNPVTGKSSPGVKYAATTRAHCETVIRTFYDFHLREGTGPIINPFPLDRSRQAGRANAHHNPMEQFKHERTGRYRPKVPKRIPRRIPDEMFNAIFAALKYNRDRAMLAFWVSTGVRAEELLTSTNRDALPGEQVIGVIRKGTRDYQRVPASPDAFVWLRLAQEEAWRRGVPRGRNAPLWWTLRRPWRPLEYPAARAMFIRVQELLGSNWSLHDLRHTATYRMTSDPLVRLTDVQWVLAHKQLTTLQIYLTPDSDEIVGHMLAHHARQERKATEQPRPPLPAPGYDPASMDVLFGRPKA
ncbi:site-specific integrase [Streptomyces sp. NPDC079189]|uniref:tyrosine-type recombinase/integrase n=1 Tax=Streptomyces sp. NPDC079189 TaxID=3154514 RepID=UPI0034392225